MARLRRMVRSIGTLSAALVFLVSFLFPPLRVFAAVNFLADYDTQYAISPTGKTIVTQNITLTNQQSNLYAKQYSITLGTTNISNVIAYEKSDNKIRPQQGMLIPKITQHDGKTDIAVQFNDQIVGLGKQVQFTLRYENNDIAKKLGNVWEIHIPGIAYDEELGNYQVSLQVPSAFGPQAYLKPAPAANGFWNKQQMLEGGISAAYGTTQEFAVELTYNLENEGMTPGITEVSIPPDTSFQKVTILSVEPKPATIRRDEDGNWIAQYQLAAGQKLDAKAKLNVSTSVAPRIDYSSESADPSQYLSPQPFWNSDDAQIRALATTLKTPRDIFDYVVKTLSYDKSRLEQGPIRKGAIQALANPKNSVCTEFTDLFIAIARAAGIPAREVVGYAYTTDPITQPLSLVSDVLHAWPEYFDQKANRWVPVDPTWSNTTGGIDYFDQLDFNHIAFVVHGKSSETPYPAGSYKVGTQPKKNVIVKFADITAKPQEGMTTTIDIPDKVTAGYPLKGTVTVVNTGGANVDEVNITVQSDPFRYILTKKEKNVPPFGKISLPIAIPIDSFILRGQGRVVVSVNGETTSKYFTVTPMYWLLAPISLIFLAVLILLWLAFRKR